MVPAVAVVGIGRRYPPGLDVGPMRRRGGGERQDEPTPAASGAAPIHRPPRIRRLDDDDPAAFGLSRGEAARLSPEDRLLLELSREAVEDAGLFARPGEPGVVVIGDWRAARARRRQADVGELIDPAGRISRALGWTGPCLTVDTSTSSSLAAVHLACEQLGHREFPFALAGGVGLVRSRSFRQSFSAAGLLSRHGRCRFGDASADGTALAEGGALVVLKRLDDAVRDADSIVAVILGSSLLHQGPGEAEGLAPDPDAQQRLVRAAIASAGVEPADYAYVECHGTGTSRGDLAELEALSRVFGARVARKDPVPVGSIKTRVGHTGAASGVIGLLHAADALNRRVAPCTCPGFVPRPDASWLGIRLATESVPIRERSVVGVTSLGLSGTNVHVILGESDPSPVALPSRSPRRVELLVLSSGSAEGLRSQVQRFRRFLESPEAAAAGLCDVCAAAALRRVPRAYRIAVWGDSLGALRDALRRRLRGSSVLPRSEPLASAPREIVEIADRFESGESVDFSVLYPPPVRWVALPIDTGRTRGVGPSGVAEANSRARSTRSRVIAGSVDEDRVAEDVARLVAEELGCPPSADRPDASLVELGLDSLGATRLAGSIRRRMSVVLTSTFLLDRGTTIPALIARLREEHALERLSANGPDEHGLPTTEVIVL